MKVLSKRGFLYEIEAKYKYDYPKSPIFILKKVDSLGFVFFFECGHSMTDLAFEFMINATTGIPITWDLELTLF